MIQEPKIELVINVKTARTLGISFPLSLLGRADGGDRIDEAVRRHHAIRRRGGMAACGARAAAGSREVVGMLCAIEWNDC